METEVKPQSQGSWRERYKKMREDMKHCTMIKNIPEAWTALEEWRRSERDEEKLKEAIDWIVYRRGMSDYSEFICSHCGQRESDAYFLKDDVWLEAWPERQGTLHLKCVEERLGRELTADDFKAECHWNNGILHVLNRSKS